MGIKIFHSHGACTKRFGALSIVAEFEELFTGDNEDSQECPFECIVTHIDVRNSQRKYKGLHFIFWIRNKSHCHTNTQCDGQATVKRTILGSRRYIYLAM